jgi:hydrogenase maturation protein HypF
VTKTVSAGKGGTIEQAIPLSRPVPTVLAVGPFLKNTVCLLNGDQALLSTDAGNLDSAESIRQFEDNIAVLLAVAETDPAVVAHDLHPDFHSTRFARGLGCETLAVQHHHAHIAAIMAEHGHEGPVLGLALDGFGLGPENQSWGGELLLVDAEGYRRLGHLALLKQPGADAAARQPWRMGAAALHSLGRDDEIAERFKDINGASVIAGMLQGNVNCPTTSSCGRLFDAACGLLGVKLVAAFEGEAPMALEAMVTRPRVAPGAWRIDDGVLQLTGLLERLCDLPAADGADLFHGTLVAAMTEWVARAAEETGVNDVAMGGGCFFNKVLLGGLMETLEERGLRPLSARHVTSGDGAVSLGQAWAAALTKL